MMRHPTPERTKPAPQLGSLRCLGQNRAGVAGEGADGRGPPACQVRLLVCDPSKSQAPSPLLNTAA